MVVGLLAIAWPSEARAVRPFVTDDARIIDRGQLETENWLDFKRARGWGASFNVMAGLTINDWSELIVGGSTIFDGPRQIGLGNPVIQPKILLLRAEDDGVPGVALAAGVTLPVGVGPVYEPVTGMYLVAPITSRLFDDWLMLHLNVGFKVAVPEHQRATITPYWGAGIDLGVGTKQARIIAEAYAGDPLEPLGADIAVQAGIRWLPSDYLNLDLTFGGTPELGHGGHATGRLELWGQVGVRLLFDVFTRNGRAGEPTGAAGAIKRRPKRSP